jgi:predicted nucleotidyltransferase component of viral defense system
MAEGRKLRDPGASARARLLNLARQRRQPLDLLLTRFVLERLLYRLSISPHRSRFLLKGAILLATWLPDPYRPTRDLDLLGFGDPSPESLLQVFCEILAAVPAVDDGVAFDAGNLRIDPIREAQEYGGLRLRTIATIAGARVNVVVDVGFGDALEPGAEEVELPVLLNLPAPRLRAYARETVVAEKFQAMVVLGRANSRMKDFYDIWLLIGTHDLAPERLARAISATFVRRRTPIPAEVPDALSPEFALDEAKRRQWAAFVEGLAVEPGSLEDVVRDLREFLMPAVDAAMHFPSGQRPKIG